MSKLRIDGITIKILKKKKYKFNKIEFCELKVSEVEDFINLVKKKNKKVGLALGDFKIISRIKNFKKIDFIKILSEDIKNINEIKKIIKHTNKKTYLSMDFIKEKTITNFLNEMKNYKRKIGLVYTSTKKNHQLSDLMNIKRLKIAHKIEVCYGNCSNNLKFIFLSSFFNPDSIFFYVKNSSMKRRYKNISDELHALDLNHVKHYLKMINLLSLKSKF